MPDPDTQHGTLPSRQLTQAELERRGLEFVRARLSEPESPFVDGWLDCDDDGTGLVVRLATADESEISGLPSHVAGIPVNVLTGYVAEG